MSTPHQPKIGLLPLYLQLYDELLPDIRAGFDAFINRIATALTQRGITVETVPVCRIAPEFAQAIKNLDDADVDALLTVHLAYSPSLEAIDAFCRTDLPLIILDTTMDANFGIGVSPDRIMYG